MAIQLAQMRSGMVAGLVLIEGVFRVVNDSTFEPDVAALIRDLRGEEGERLVLADNAIIERYLPRLTMRQLIPEELEAYREPHRTAGEARRAMLSMIRQLPIRSQPGPIDDVMEQSRVWCSRSKLPKLVIGGSPGFLTPAAVLGTVARWANASHASVRGLHYLMEDSPARIARTILDWVGELEGV